LTIYPSYWLIDLIYNPLILGHIIFVGRGVIEIVDACVAGSAYFLLLMLNLATPSIKIGKRISLLLSTFGMFLVLNLIRIFILSVMYLEGSPIFDATHKAFWYLGSTVFVIFIWFLGVKIFRIDKVPFYDDLKFMYNNSSLKKK
jgi:exosortase/archaeosortase family protein